MGEYETLVNLISNFGFPIVITVYLLHRFEKKIDALVENINKLSNAIDKQLPKK